MLVVFVGHSPSPKAEPGAYAFVGTRSGVTLDKWAVSMGLKRWSAINLGQVPGKLPPISDVMTSVAKTVLCNLIEHDNVKVVSLGVEVDNRLNQLKIEHFALPHPSGLNRKINNKVWLQDRLDACKKWLQFDTMKKESEAR